MNTKDKLLDIFLECINIPISGQDLAQQLQVSRTAIWKHIHSLVEDGYDIESIPHQGYVLKNKGNVLSKAQIQKETNNLYVEVFDTIDSTNTYAKQRMDLEDGTLIVANEQTKGRGRRDHSFYSPKDDGLYFSIVLRPKQDLAAMLKVTVAAAVAVCEAIEELTNKKPEIKWVNDIFIDKKKICGILTEATTDFESRGVESIIVGIGLNVSNTSFPEDISEIAGSIEHNLDRNVLVSTIYNHFMVWTTKLNSKELMDEYRNRSMVLGKTVYFNNTSGLVKDINDDGNLVIEDEHKNTTLLQSGEISIKL